MLFEHAKRQNSAKIFFVQNLFLFSPFKGIEEKNGLLRPENWNFYLYYSHIKFLISFNLFSVVTELKSRGYTEFEWLWNLVVTSRRNFVFVPSQFDYIGRAPPPETSSSLWFRYLSFFVIQATQTYICGCHHRQPKKHAFLLRNCPGSGKCFEEIICGNDFEFENVLNAE